VRGNRGAVEVGIRVSTERGAFCNRVYYRNALPPQWVDFAVGFRLALDAPVDGGS